MKNYLVVKYLDEEILLKKIALPSKKEITLKKQNLWDPDKFLPENLGPIFLSPMKTPENSNSIFGFLTKIL